MFRVWITPSVARIRANDARFAAVGVSGGATGKLLQGRCPDCGMKIERVAQLPGKASFFKSFGGWSSDVL